MLSDVALRLVRDRYEALSRLRAVNGGRDWFEARMLGRRALVLRGQEGTRVFYDSTLVTRRGAVPAPIRLLLFGPGAVHGLEGEAHSRRKRLFLQIVDAKAVDELSAAVAARLTEVKAHWPGRSRVRLFDELVQVYGAAVLDWAGTESSAPETSRISRELATIVDGFGVAGTSYPRAWLGRVRATLWARRLVREVRRGTRRPGLETPLARIAAADLPDTVAAVELLNVLRPTVAVAYFGSYAAHALEAHPDWKDRLASGSVRELSAFEHEVRRWYPFTPLLTGRTVRQFVRDGQSLPAGSWMVLDVLGTNNDPVSWHDPEVFRPERFLDREPNAYEYVPHGGGDPATGHRCPGEPLAVGILQTTLRLLASLDFELASQSRTVELHRVPSLPPRHMELLNVRPARG